MRTYDTFKTGPIHACNAGITVAQHDAVAEALKQAAAASIARCHCRSNARCTAMPKFASDAESSQERRGQQCSCCPAANTLPIPCQTAAATEQSHHITSQQITQYQNSWSHCMPPKPAHRTQLTFPLPPRHLVRLVRHSSWSCSCCQHRLSSLQFTESAFQACSAGG
jgi:hypothetical protein